MIAFLTVFKDYLVKEFGIKTLFVYLATISILAIFLGYSFSII